MTVVTIILVFISSINPLAFIGPKARQGYISSFRDVVPGTAIQPQKRAFYFSAKLLGLPRNHESTPSIYCRPFVFNVDRD